MTSAIQKRLASRPLVIAGALSFIALLAELGYQTTAVAGMPFFLKDELRLPVRIITLINVCFLVAETGAKIPFGVLSDRYGRRFFIICGPLLSALAAFAITRGPSPNQVAAIRALDGIGAAMLWPALFATVADVVEERIRATAMSLFNAMYIGGIVAGPLLYSGVFSRTGSQVAIFWVLALFFVMAAGVAYFVSPRRATNDRRPAASGEEVPDASAWRVVRGNPVLMAMLVVAVVQFVGLHMLNGVLSIYLNEQIHVQKEQIGHLFLYIGLVVGPFAIPMGRLADRIGKPRAVRLGLGICAVGMWLLPWVRAVPLLVVTAGIFGIGFLLASPAWLALMTELAGDERRGGVVGIMNTGQGIGAALGAAVGGSLYDYLGPRAPFLASALLFTVSVLVVFRYVRRVPAHRQVVIR